MGWLRDLMESAPRDLRSFDELAKICLKSADWPASAGMGHRSLGAILGRLDRGGGTDWLAGRPEVQQALAGVLGIQRGSLQLALNPRQAAKAERWVTWSAMPFARGLDLTEEGLFPGLPELVMHPGRWDRVVWVAPSGGGRTLLGQWLTARGLATHAVQPVLDIASAPPGRPLLLEVGSTTGLDAVAFGPGVCLAVPEPWEPPAGFGEWHVVRSPPIRELAGPLVEWACDRLAESSDVDPVALVERVLRLADQGLVQSAGDVLGLVGVADSEGDEALETRALERLAREWLRRRARERLDQEAPESRWLRKSGFDALVAITRRVIVEDRGPLFQPRTTDEWLELVPDGLRQGPDLEWMKLALPQADPGLRPAALERASEKLPPGAFRLVRCFEHAGLLERGGDELALRPHWLGRVALHEALSSLVAGAAFDWGEALLSPTMAGATMDRLVERARSRTLPIEELIEPDGSSDPAYAAAIEGAVRALGAAELGGIHAGGDALEPLFDEQLRLAVELASEPPRPRVEHAPVPGRRGSFWLTPGAWYLAVFAFGEALDAHQGRRHALLRPWLTKEPAAGLHVILDRIARALDQPDAPRDILAPAVGLVTRLGAVLGPLGAGRTRHRLERAATVADEAAVGVLGWESVTELEGDRLARLGLLRLARERRLDHAALASEVWRAFEEAGRPEAEAGVLLTEELSDVILPHAPPGALKALARGIAVLDEAPPLAPEQWAALFTGDATSTPLGLFKLVPEPALAPALDAACRTERRDALGVLWTRFPHPLTAGLVDALRDPVIGARRQLLLETAPTSVTLDVLAELGSVAELLRGPGANLQAVRRFLHAQIAARGPGFREAYALLDELETHLVGVRESLEPRSPRYPGDRLDRP